MLSIFVCAYWSFMYLLFFFFNLLIDWLIAMLVFVSVRGLSLVVASGGHSSLRCAGLSLSRPLLLRSTGSRRAGSVVVAHGSSCPAACGIFPDQGSNPRPLHWQADSQPLRHQGSPHVSSLMKRFNRVAFLLLIFESSLYFPGTSPLSYIHITNIFSLSSHSLRAEVLIWWSPIYEFVLYRPCFWCHN